MNYDSKMKSSKRTIGAKILQSDAELIHDFCRIRSETISDFVRRAVIAELSRMSSLTNLETMLQSLPCRLVTHRRKSE